MRRGFTLLELLIVIIILGVLATLGIQQYARVVERARGAEARTILGQIRTAAAAYRFERGSCAGFNNTFAGIGTGADQIPSACRSTHYFNYTVNSANADGFTATATRCTSGGKAPNAPSAYTLILDTNFTAGTDTWSGTGGY